MAHDGEGLVLMRVFLSYRREDSAAHAGRLADALRTRLGPDGVFLDVAAIRPGTDFTAAIDDALGRSDAVLVVIGPRWLSAATQDGRPRLADPQDYVRREVSEALDSALPVVPVLVGGASLPAAQDLPDELAPLARRQAVALDDSTWHRDVDALLDSLTGGTPGAAGRGRRAVAAVVVALLVVGAVTAAVLLWPDPEGAGDPGGSGDGSSDSEQSRGPCPGPDGDTETLFGPDAAAVGRIDGEDGPLEFTITAATARPLGEGRWEVVLDTVLSNERSDVVEHGYYHYDQLEVARFPFREQSCFTPNPELVGAGQRGRAQVGFEVDVDPAQGLSVIVRNGDTSDTVALTS